MKINTSERSSVESSGVSGESGFKLKSSKHAFQLLSSGLYTNKIQAVIRELSCNAADAHVLNSNQKTAFDVKLPNRLDSQFYVRDYGPGLSDDGVMNLYTTYFESTKSESNDFTGGFGVGSKSPFAYTDMFTVESIHNGVKRIYTAYTDDNGEPKIVRLGDAEPTNAPSGLSVGFPVKPEDFVQFEREAMTVLRWFEVPVNVQGTATPLKSWKDEPALVSTPRITMPGQWTNTNQPSFSRTARTHGNSDGRLGTIVMGNVHYPLPLHACMEKSPEAAWFASQPAIFKVPVGAVSVAASREALAFDKATQTTMQSIVKDAFRDMAKEVWATIGKNLSPSMTTLADHVQARNSLNALGFNAAQMEIFMDNCNATPEQKELLKPRRLYDPKHPPKTFALFKQDSHGSWGHNANIIGSPANWKTNIKSDIDYDGNYMFVENAGRAAGVHANGAMMAVAEKHRSYRDHLIQIIPYSNVDPKEYEAEKSAWAAKLGVSVIEFSKMGQSFGDNSVEAMNPFSWNKNVSLVADTPPFFYLTTSEWNELNQRSDRDRYALTDDKLYAMQRNLGLKDEVKKWYIIQDEDKDRVKKVCAGARHLYNDFVLTTLLDSKVQKKIEKIQPMMDGMPTMFSSTRTKMRKEWGPTLGGTKLGAWLNRMDKVKTSQSFDYSTMQVLRELNAVLGDKFPTAIPEYYKGQDVKKALEEGYPFLENHAVSRHPLVPAQLAHLKEYIDWCESRGATPPVQATTDTDTPTP